MDKRSTTPHSGGESVTGRMLSGTFPDNPWPLYLRPYGEYWTQGRAKDLVYNPAQHKPFEPRPTMPADHDEVDLTEAYDARQDFRQVCRLFDECLGSELEIVHSKPTMKRSLPWLVEFAGSMLAVALNLIFLYVVSIRAVA